LGEKIREEMSSPINHYIRFLDRKMHTPFPEPLPGSGLQPGWIITRNHEVLINKGGNSLFLYLPIKDTDLIASTYLGISGNTVFYVAHCSNETTPPNGFKFVSLRDLFSISDEETSSHAAYAVQISEFNLDNRYCGRCGSNTHESSIERARICDSCGFIVYPKICPAIIVLIKKGDCILLARSPGFTTDMYSIIAGFVEAGETIESTVLREVKEEVGIAIKNLRYYASQSWPFPHSLMIGFVADHESGEIEIDNHEIEDAGWFSTYSMPLLPGPYSIAGKMIEAFIRGEI